MLVGHGYFGKRYNAEYASNKNKIKILNSIIMTEEEFNSHEMECHKNDVKPKAYAKKKVW